MLDAELETEGMIAEAALMCYREMNPLWERANNDPCWKPYYPSEAQSKRDGIPQIQAPSRTSLPCFDGVVASGRSALWRVQVLRC